MRVIIHLLHNLRVIIHLLHNLRVIIHLLHNLRVIIHLVRHDFLMQYILFEILYFKILVVWHRFLAALWPHYR